MTAILGIDPGTHRSAWLLLVDGRPTAFGLEDNDALVAKLRGAAGQLKSRFASVYLDTNNKGEAVAQTDDLALHAGISDGTTSGFRGSGVPNGYVPAVLPGWSAATSAAVARMRLVRSTSRRARTAAARSVVPSLPSSLIDRSAVRLRPSFPTRRRGKMRTPSCWRCVTARFISAAGATWSSRSKRGVI